MQPPGSWGYTILGTGDTSFAGSEPQFGSAVAVSPDMNGDGRDEVVVGALAAGDGPGYVSAGAGYVFWGKSDTADQTVDAAVLRVHGRHGGAGLGWSVAAAGDVNDDGVPDVAFSAPDVRDVPGDLNSTVRGQVVVLYGTDQPTTVDDTALGTAGFTVTGAPGDRLGLYTHSLAGVGDQNGDGRNDLLVGSVSSGRSYVVYSPPGPGNVALSNMGASAYRLVAGGGYGYVVGSVRDQDGDGVTELATTDYAASTNGRNQNGVLYVIPGGTRTGEIAASAAAAFRIHGPVDVDRVNGVTSFPDLSGDGLDELLLARYNGAGGDSYIDIVTLDDGGDRAPPTIRCSVAVDLWHSANVTIDCTATDQRSGLALSADAHFQLRTDVPASVETASAATDTRRVCDRAGNCAVAGPVEGIRIDRRPPSVSISCPESPVGLHAFATATVTASDGGSGLAKDPTGPVPLDTRSPGTASISAVATDNAGNSAGASCAYRVIVDLPAPLEPLPKPPSVVLTAGRGRTFRFALSGYKSGRVIAAGYPTQRRIECTTKRPVGASKRIAAGLRYHAKKDRYSFTWFTRKKMRGSCRELAVRFRDKTLHRVWLSLK